ncbi:MAG: hemerythrin domain-containing protein, partial [Microcystaceae cyanobacterium]
MASTMTDTKRTAIAEKLADIRAIQNLIIANEQQLLNECSDSQMRDRLQKMIEDDQKNIGIIETTITAYGIQAEPRQTVKEMVEKAPKMMQKSELTLYEKMSQHELLKHGQVMSGIVVHKAAQAVGADVEQALTPLNTVNFENRAHQEYLMGFLEVLGTRELTGLEADKSVWARVQDAIAALTGVIGSAVTKSSDQSDMKVQDVIRMDHQKVNTLFTEIENTKDSQKMREYYGQIYQDLSVHAEAEEQTVYPKVRSFYNDVQELYDEQAELKVALEEAKGLNPGSDEFMSKVQQIKNMV